MMDSKPTVLVTGSGGQLGQELQALSSSFPEFKFFFTKRDDLSLEDQEQVNAFFEKQKIDHCINAAAYTAVDKAEQEKEKANLINGTAVGFLAAAAKRSGASFIHISTDYVFDGTSTRPYLDTDPVAPINAYGASKLLGEKEALQHYQESIVIRTSWVYSRYGNNFVKTMLRLMKERDSLNVVDDQRGCPTYAADLAEAIMQIVTSGKAHNNGGIYGYSNTGIISWYEFAVAIRDYAELHCKINPIPSSAFPTPAARPKYSALDHEKLVSTFSISPKHWSQSLKKCLNLLQ
jgi:dTDP-4-dehydrorhamnose reductase